MKRANWKLGLAVNSRTFPSPLWINPVFYFMFIFFGFCGSFWDWMKNTFDSWLIEKRVFYLRADSSLGGLCGSLWQKKKNVLGQDNLGPNISQKYITHTCTYSHTQKTHTFPRDWRDLLRRCITLSQKAGSLFFFFSFPRKAPQQTPKTHSAAHLHEIWNKDELYTTPAHLTCQIYAPYAAVQELLQRHTCSPMWQGSDASFMSPHWIILPECIIDTFNLSCRSVFDLSLQDSQAGCIMECTLWSVSV